MMKNRFIVIVLFALITLIVVYISIPVYGVIRDLANEDGGEAVFVLGSPLPDPGKIESKNGIFERIHQFLFPSTEVSVPIERRVDIKGRIVYSDKTPYVNGIVELRSEPRYSRTDDDGYFMFRGIEEGAHIISLLDEEGNTLVKSSIHIERNPDSKDIELLHLPDNTLVFRVAVSIELLELTLTLKHDVNTGMFVLEKVELGIANSRTGPLQPHGDTESSGTPKPSAAPGGPAKPAASPGGPAEPSATPNKPAQPTVTPENPQIPETTPANPAAPTPYFPPVSDRFNFTVTDTADRVQYGSESAVNVNIFGSNKRIAPGMKGSYSFTVDNRNNNYPARYDITFLVVDTLPPANKIPMLYRLKKDGVYVAGALDIWRTSAELHQDAALDGGKYAKYTLDWYWPEGAKDNDYAQFGGDSNYSYSLIIKVTASKK